MPRYLSPVEFTATLKGALSLSTIYLMLEKGNIPGAIQPSGKRGKWLIPEGALDSLEQKAK